MESASSRRSFFQISEVYQHPSLLAVFLQLPAFDLNLHMPAMTMDIGTFAGVTGQKMCRIKICFCFLTDT